MLLLGRTAGLVSGVHVDSNNVSNACTSIHSVLQRTLVRETARVTIIRGRPSKGVRPDRPSEALARRVHGTTSAVGVHLVSRIVIYRSNFCDFTSRKLL